MYSTWGIMRAWGENVIKKIISSSTQVIHWILNIVGVLMSKVKPDSWTLNMYGELHFSMTDSSPRVNSIYYAQINNTISIYLRC